MCVIEVREAVEWPDCKLTIDGTELYIEARCLSSSSNQQSVSIKMERNSRESGDDLGNSTVSADVVPLNTTHNPTEPIILTLTTDEYGRRVFCHVFQCLHDYGVDSFKRWEDDDKV